MYSYTINNIINNNIVNHHCWSIIINSCSFTLLYKVIFDKPVFDKPVGLCGMLPRITLIGSDLIVNK